MLERVAAEQHERAQALGPAGRDELRDRAAGVVAVEDHVLELERGKQAGDHVRDSLHRELADVGTPEIAKAAGVTRGAMYHQFADKAALFLAVIEAVEADVMVQLAELVAQAAPQSAAHAIRVAADAWIEAAMQPEIRQLLLLDAPNVLGWETFREVAQRYGLGMTEQLLAGAMEAGELKQQPVRPRADAAGRARRSGHVRRHRRRSRRGSKRDTRRRRRPDRRPPDPRQESATAQAVALSSSA